MSRLKDAPPDCPHCGMQYSSFSTGMTYDEVRSSLWSTDPDPGTWKYRRRNTVLGKWYQIKQEMWEEHLETCGKLADLSEELVEIEEY